MEKLSFAMGNVLTGKCNVVEIENTFDSTKLQNAFIDAVKSKIEKIEEKMYDNASKGKLDTTTIIDESNMVPVIKAYFESNGCAFENGCTPGAYHIIMTASNVVSM